MFSRQVVFGLQFSNYEFIGKSRKGVCIIRFILNSHIHILLLPLVSFTESHGK